MGNNKKRTKRILFKNKFRKVSVQQEVNKFTGLDITHNANNK